jgi:hypothetical protein
MMSEFPRPDKNFNNPNIIKSIILPSGRRVDVVSYVQESASSKGCRHGSALANCPACGHDRVQPTHWSEVGTSHWRVNLRCPDCEERREAIFGQTELDAFDVALDEGTRSVCSDLDLLARANMADDIDRFTKALNAGHIAPEDF